MPFLGKTPAQGFVNSVTKDDFTPNGTTTAFTLSKAPATVNEIEVYVGNVRQEPTDAYSVSGTTLTMTEAPVTGTNFYVMHIGGTTQSSTTLPGGSTVPGDFNVSGVLDATTATFDRASTDGVIVNLQKNNGSVGSIGTTGGDVTIDGGSEHTGLRFEDTQITPRHNGAYSNNWTGLGTASNRFKDLYLGDGIYLGGTGATNKLDEYEEGAWVPEFRGSSGSAGSASTLVSMAQYTRIGRLVTIQCDLRWSTIGSWGGNLELHGLPFTVGVKGQGTPGLLKRIEITQKMITAVAYPSGTVIKFFDISSDLGVKAPTAVTRFNDALNEFTMTMSYSV